MVPKSFSISFLPNQDSLDSLSLLSTYYTVPSIQHSSSTEKRFFFLSLFSFVFPTWERESHEREREEERNNKPIYLFLSSLYIRTATTTATRMRRKTTTRKGSLERVRALTHLSTFLLLWSICNTTMAGQRAPNVSPHTHVHPKKNKFTTTTTTAMKYAFQLCTSRASITVSISSIPIWYCWWTSGFF